MTKIEDYDSSSFTTTLLSGLNVNVDILLTCEKYLQDVSFHY